MIIVRCDHYTFTILFLIRAYKTWLKDEMLILRVNIIYEHNNIEIYGIGDIWAKQLLWVEFYYLFGEWDCKYEKIFKSFAYDVEWSTVTLK